LFGCLKVHRQSDLFRCPNALPVRDLVISHTTIVEVPGCFALRTLSDRPLGNAGSGWSSGYHIEDPERQSIVKTPENGLAGSAEPQIYSKSYVPISNEKFLKASPHGRIGTSHITVPEELTKAR